MYINSELGKTPKWIKKVAKPAAAFFSGGATAALATSDSRRVRKVALPLVGFATAGLPGAAWGRAKANPKGAPGTAQRRRYQRSIKVAQRTTAVSAAVAAGAIAAPYVSAAAGSATSLIPKITGGIATIAKAVDAASSRPQNGAGNGSGGTGRDGSNNDTSWMPLLLGGAALLLFGGF